jgi:YidC/Oxa1 family membrane protein insertase
MMKNMPAAALDNPFAKQQKMLLYVLPLVFAVSGVNFPIGVLLYWLTTNVWSMGQQFYVIRRMPAPGSPAERALQERRRKHGRAPLEQPDEQDEAAAAPASGQRVQPKRQARSKRGTRPDAAPTAPDAAATGGPSLTKKPRTSGDAPAEAPAETRASEPAGDSGPTAKSPASTTSGSRTSGKPAASTTKATKPAAGKKTASTGKQGGAAKRTKPTGGSKSGRRPR